MKKIIIAAIAVAFAAVSQAATFKWQATNGLMPDTTTKLGNTFYGFFVDDSVYSYADAVAALAGGSADFINDYGVASKAFTSGVASQTITTTAGNGDTLKGYVVILDNASYSDATMAYITATTGSATIPTSGAAQTIKFDVATTGTASNWYSVNVPEPTSGLLLLLGMAGLALKRKHA